MFDFLLDDYFVSVSYTVVRQTFNFTERNKSRVFEISSFHKFLKHISEIYGSYPQSVNQEKTVLFSKFAEVDWARIEDKFSKTLEVTSIHLGSELCYVLNVEKSKGIGLTEYPDKSEVECIGVKSDSNEFLLSHARDHGPDDYVYELNNRGLLAVKYKMGVSVLRRVDKHSYKDPLAYFSDSFRELENVTYAVEASEVLGVNKKNPLVLSSYTNKSNENMIDRYYSHPFSFISSSIMPNTYIARMADVPDTFGNHGLNAKFGENIEDNIQRPIKSLMSIYGVDKKNVVVCGVSSGGTGAIHHGLIGKYKILAIDLFSGNHKYYSNKDPLYLYPIRTPILEIFKKLPNTIDHNLENRIVILSAEVSEFCPDIKELKEALPAVVLCGFDFKKIQKHIDFSGNTVFLSNTTINNLLLDIHITDSDISPN